jgi:hypothetical protein
VAQGALLGIYGTSIIDATFLDAAGAALFEAQVKSKHGAGLTQGFLGAVPADLFHGRIPRCDFACPVKCKNTISHGFQEIPGKPGVEVVLLGMCHGHLPELKLNSERIPRGDST